MAFLTIKPWASADKKRIITVVTMVPSILINAYVVYHSYIKHNILDYLKTEFVFSNTQLVQSSFDRNAKTISMSLVETPISEETIAFLKRELDEYDLGDYTLHVTQNTIYTGTEGGNPDKITIAIQENTIATLQEQLAAQQVRLDELESSAATKLDFNELAQKAERIFPDLTSCSCGITADASGEYIILAATVEREFTDSEITVINNWRKAG